MPHICTRCNNVFEYGEDILKGCPACGWKKFMFMRKVPPQSEDTSAGSSEQIITRAMGVRMPPKREKISLDMEKSRPQTKDEINHPGSAFSSAPSAASSSAPSAAFSSAPSAASSSTPSADPAATAADTSGRVKPAIRRSAGESASNKEAVASSAILTPSLGEKDDKSRQSIPSKEKEEIERQDKTGLIDGKALESIKITAPGTYELNLPSLFERDGLIMAVKDETYFIDLTSAFKKSKKD